MVRTMRYSTFILNVPFLNFKVTCLITCLLLYWPKIHRMFCSFLVILASFSVYAPVTLQQSFQIILKNKVFVKFLQSYYRVLQRFHCVLTKFFKIFQNHLISQDLAKKILNKFSNKNKSKFILICCVFLCIFLLCLIMYLN